MKKVFLSLLVVACAPQQMVIPTLNPDKAQLHAEAFLKNLMPGEEVNGPICMPEAVHEQMTQCSYSFKSEDEWKVGSLLCGNDGCRNGEFPAVVSQDVMPASVTSGGGSLDNDFLLFWMLMNSGTTHYHSYDVWHSNTPAHYRSVYYAPGYRPTTEAVKYYNTTYSRGLRNNASLVVSKPTTTTTTRPITTKPTTIKPTTTRPTRSSGFGTRPSRSSGYSSSRSRR